MRIAGTFRRVLGLSTGTPLNLRWVKRGAWLADHLAEIVPQAPWKGQIERTANATNRLGSQKLADEYGEANGVRTPDAVRSSSDIGDFFAWLVELRRPNTVVEFGAAFGVSGMYFAAGLEAARTGRLYSFEINDEWADIAERNIQSVSDRFTLTRGAFEGHVATVVPGSIDLAFVDAIHTYEFVLRQFEILRPRMSAGGIIMFDDINFAKPGARMREAWEVIAARHDIVAAVEVHGRMGIAELT
jgi:predicted O-methyltransferase YrrM